MLPLDREADRSESPAGSPELSLSTPSTPAKHLILYADDTAYFVSSYRTKLVIRLQVVLDNLKVWCRTRCMGVNPSKSNIRNKSRLKQFVQKALQDSKNKINDVRHRNLLEQNFQIFGSDARQGTSVNPPRQTRNQ